MKIVAAKDTKHWEYFNTHQIQATKTCDKKCEDVRDVDSNLTREEDSDRRREKLA
jgi:hypothetical protein